MIFSIIVSLLGLSVTTIVAIALRIECMKISLEFGIVFLILTIVFAVTGGYFSVYKAIKSNRKRYLLFILIPIVIFLVQITFRNNIWEIWHLLFDTLPSPSTLPTLN